MNFNKNEKNLRDLTNREIVMCVSSLIDDLHQIRHNLVTNSCDNLSLDFDKLDEFYIYDYETCATEYYQELLKDAETEEEKEEITQQYNDLDYSEFCQEHNLDAEPMEIFEYWLVTNFLACKLESIGECVVDVGLPYKVWGRTTTGQSICLDSCISKIYENLNKKYPEIYPINE